MLKKCKTADFFFCNVLNNQPSTLYFYIIWNIDTQTVICAHLFRTVSLQDINMRKAFKSSTTQDQQVVSKSSLPNPVKDIYNLSDKPPPLSILSSYRLDIKKKKLKNW